MLKMSELSAMFESLGYESVKTYINSGNVGFDSPRASETKIVATIESAIEEAFGKKILVMIRRQKEIEQVFANNPFEGEFESHKEMHVLFLKEEMPPDKSMQLLAAQSADERFAIVGREIFCHSRPGVADSLLGKGFIDKKLKISYTARNWRTVQKLAEL